jgi:hypothetical protein
VLALGVMGLNYDYFYSLTPRVFYNVHAGYNQRVEMEYKDNWVRTRKIMFAVLQPHLKDKNSTEASLIRFPWENDEDVVEAVLAQNEDQAQEVLREQEEYWKAIDRKRQLKKSKFKNDFDGISTD